MQNAAPWPSTPEPAQGLPAAPRRRGLKWKFILIAGLVGAFLVIGALYGLSEITRNAAGIFGVPSDLPVYPAATLVGVHENVSPGETRVDASWQADAALDAVTTFYSARLDNGQWQIVKKDPVTGIWEFRHADGKIRGLIELSAHGQETRIDVTLFK